MITEHGSALAVVGALAPPEGRSWPDARRHNSCIRDMEAVTQQVQVPVIYDGPARDSRS